MNWAVLIAKRILECKQAITAEVIATDYSRRPELMFRYGERGRMLYKRDNDYHLDFLAEAIGHDEPALFVDYIAWVKSMLISRGVRVEDLVENLLLLKTVIMQQLIDDEATTAIVPIEAALAHLPRLPESPPDFISVETSLGRLTQDYLNYLLQGNRREAVQLIDQALAAGVPLKQIYLDVFQRSQREIGRLWQMNRITVAQEHFCTAATMTIMNQFYRSILEVPKTGLRAAALCVAGDLHEIGVRIVADFFDLAGWDCDYYGANTPGKDLLATLEQHPPDIIALSATMTYHVTAVGDLIEKLRKQPLLKKIPVIVGGRPFLVADRLWRSVGADGWAADAESAVSKATELVKRN